MADIMLIQGSAQHLSLQDKSIHCALFSPPYFNLRRYEEVRPEYWPGGMYRPSPGASHIAVEAETTCFGNEHTVQAYVWHMLLVLREVRRTLREDGTCWLCLGDGFATNPGNGRGGERVDGGIPHRSGSDKTGQGYPSGCLLGIPWLVAHAAIADGWVLRDESVWWKDSCMPENVKGSRWEKRRCTCLQPHKRRQQAYVPPGADHQINFGMNFRGDLSPQPDPLCPHCQGTGSLEDWVLRKGAWRHTRATESVFMLSKTMNYWSDSEAVLEKAATEGDTRSLRADRSKNPGGPRADNGRRFNTGTPTHGRNPRNTLREAPSAAADLRALMQWLQAEAPEVLDAYHEAHANPGNVLRPQASWHGLAHYAAFPAALLGPLIKASCPAQCCPVCGTGFAPIISEAKTQPDLSQRKTAHYNTAERYGAQNGGNSGLDKLAARMREGRHGTTVHSYAPTCAHYCTCTPATSASPCPFCRKLPLSVSVPGKVLDCFAGVSTTLVVARELGRSALGVEASLHYVHLSRQRLGLTDLARWQGEASPLSPETYEDLPLFAP
jgi:hypothetical protein